jgi:hypothetical protein
MYITRGVSLLGFAVAVVLSNLLPGCAGITPRPTPPVVPMSPQSPRSQPQSIEEFVNTPVITNFAPKREKTVAGKTIALVYQNDLSASL